MHSICYRILKNNLCSFKLYHHIQREKLLQLSKVSLVYTKQIRFLETNTNDGIKRIKNNDTFVSYDDPDTFGLIGRTNSILTEQEEEDEGDKIEDKFINEFPLHKDKLPMQKYIDMIKLHVANNRIKEAIDILEIRMLKEDRVKPDAFIYNLLIGSCARIGYTHKAFKLFNDMKRRGLKVSGGVYTSLFNACANSPYKDDGVRRVNKLRELMIEKSVSTNITMYNCMIKAYGRCGDIKAAFAVVDEMLELKIPLRTHTFNFLLQACISDKESGFRSALVTWRKMLTVKEKPNIYTFNLMLRCIKECGFGNNTNNEIILRDLLALKPPKRTNLLLNEKPPEILNILGDSTDNKSSNVISYRSVEKQSVIPNFLAKFPEMKDTLGLGSVICIEDRFLMVGGLKGIINEMELYFVKPDIKTFTQLLEVIPNTLEEETKILTVMEHFKVKKDIDFCNMLMKKRCFRCDYNSAKDVLKMMDKENKVMKRKSRFVKRKKLLRKDIITYGILAMCCDTKTAAEEYIQQIDEAKIRINAQILGSLLRQAICHNDFDYINYVIDLVTEKNVLLNNVFMEHLNKYHDFCTASLRKTHKNDHHETHTKFVSNYEKMMSKLINRINDEPENPWEQFRVNQPETLQRFKDHVSFKRKIYRTFRYVPRYEVKV